MNDRRVPNGTRLNQSDVSVSHNVPALQDSRLRGNDKVRSHPRESGPPTHAGLTYRDLKMLHHCKIPAYAGMTKYGVIPAKAGIS
jgi:hypothetical protein